MIKDIFWRHIEQFKEEYKAELSNPDNKLLLDEFIEDFLLYDNLYDLALYIYGYLPSYNIMSR